MLTAILIILIFQLMFTIGLYGAINQAGQHIKAFAQTFNAEVEKQAKRQNPRMN